MRTPSLGLLLTYQCRRSCSFCGNRGTESSSWPHMSLPLAKKALKNAGQEGLTKLYLSGGEPLLHQQIVEIIDLAADNGFTEVDVQSGGWRQSEDQEMRGKIRQILDQAERRNLRCSFSLSFSPLANNGDERANIDTWRTTIATLQSFGSRLYEHTPLIHGTFVVSSGDHNANFYASFRNTMEGLGAECRLLDVGMAQPARSFYFFNGSLVFTFTTRNVGASGRGVVVAGAKKAKNCLSANYNMWLHEMTVTPTGGFQPCDVVMNEADQRGALIDFQVIVTEPFRFCYEWFRDNQSRLFTLRRQIYRAMGENGGSFHQACVQARQQLLAEDGIPVL